MAIRFGGLATGLDTNALITELINAERAPITRLQGDKTWMQNRLNAFKEADTKMRGLLDAVSAIKNSDQYYTKKATVSSDEFFTASASQDALPGTSYAVEVVSLAQVQKSYTQSGFASKTDNSFGTGTIDLTIGGETTEISITTANNSLEGIMQAINDAELGVSANIINNGTNYLLTLTGEDVATSFSVDSSGLTGGSGVTLGTIATTQPASQAHIRVDGIDIYSDANTIEEAIPGITLNLLAGEEGTTSQLTIAEDNGALKKNINTFVKAYNEIVSFIGAQSTMGDTKAGVLGGDASLNAIKRRLQNLLTTFTSNEGSFKAMSQLGLETQKDGTLSLDSSIFDKAVESDFDSLVTLVAGTEERQGVADLFEEYLENMTSSGNGFLAGRENAINNNIKRVDRQIELQEARLNKREETLRAQFTAMEQLVSVMNAQSNYLTQQLTNIANLGKDR